MLAVICGAPALYAVGVIGHGLDAKILYMVWVAAAVGLLALVAPLVGKPRRFALWALLPPYAIAISWRFGKDLVRLARAGQRGASPSPEPGRSTYTVP